jgi:cytosine/adenosine deaminase-related metal-dependent hydrolase
MHVHLSWTTASALPLLVANGVTCVRDLGSHLAQIDPWRAEIAAGVRVGPRIVRAGPILNGRSFNEYQLVTGDPEQARGIVRALKQVGVDLVKVHRRVARDSYFAIADEAKKQGLPLVGHIPMTVTPEEASDQGQLIEHTETLFEGTFSAGLKEDELPEAIRRFRSEGAEALFARFVRNHTPVTPTLVPWGHLVTHPDPLADPRMRYVARSVKEAQKRAPPMSPEDRALLERSYAEYRAVVAQMNRAGVVLLAGTDIAGARVPGFFLHDELSALVDAGLTPLQALRAATANAAAILHKESELGSVTPGKLADLVLVEGNPLERIENTHRIAAVVLGGKLLRRADLDRLLRLGEEMASRN